MFWNKKEDEKSRLPDLPISKPNFHVRPPTIEQDDLGLESHALSAFPDAQNQKGFSQTAIKNTIDTKNLPELPTLPEPPEEIAKIKDIDKDIKTVEMEEWIPSQQPIKEIKPLPRLRNTDVFVKIDKFNSVKRSLYEIKESLGEIDSLLSKIRETKMREEQELSLWEREIETTKSHIQKITEDIFEKIE